MDTEKSPQPTIGTHVAFEELREGELVQIWGILISFTKSPHTNEYSPVIVCDGETQPRVIPFAFLQKIMTN